MIESEDLYLSIVVPVYNRPDEVRELLESLVAQTRHNFEVIIVEDGSELRCDDVVEKFERDLRISYHYKENSGPGLSRNFGAGRASGEYLIFLDSDCIAPSGYIAQVTGELSRSQTDAFGGPDRAHESFTAIQKSIDYAMTSPLTTGGIRGGGKGRMDRFYPRSFNMGVKRSRFEELGGFADMRVGEDIDLSIRMIEAGYNVRLFPNAWVYHKRRTDYTRFLRQVRSFGRARVVLARKYPGTLKPVHVLPSIFVLGAIATIMVSLFFPWLLLLIALYVIVIFVDASLRTGSVVVGSLSVVSTTIQLMGYGGGFINGLLQKQ